ncbi:MAG TPA: hypothetical protein PLW14_10370 [Chlorobiota bacterium]|nr:hypothetical protein [Chlorobiota bacterium]
MTRKRANPVDQRVNEIYTNHTILTQTQFFAVCLSAVACKRSIPELADRRKGYSSIPISYTTPIWKEFDDSVVCYVNFNNTLGRVVVVKPIVIGFEGIPFLSAMTTTVDDSTTTNDSIQFVGESRWYETQDFILWPQQKVVFRTVIPRAEIETARREGYSNVVVKWIVFRPSESLCFQYAIKALPAPDTVFGTLTHNTHTVSLYGHLIDRRFPVTHVWWDGLTFKNETHHETISVGQSWDDDYSLR